MKSINPATGELIREYPEMGRDEIDKIIDEAARAQKQWRERSYAERSGPLRNIAALLNEQKEDLGRLMAEEMGKPLAQGISEAEKCAWVCEYYAEHAAEFLQEEYIETDASRSYVTFNPLGVVLSIMPWNFPFWQVFRFGAPALMAGNGIILKHAPNVTGCALRIEEIIHEAGIPEKLFRTVIADVDQTQQMILNDTIKAVTLTGSTRAGKAVSSRAGSVLKKTVLELGGSDPYIILEDASLEQAVERCVTSRLLNSGQSCIAAKRFIVVEAVYDEFLERFKALMEAKVVGDPLDDTTDIGPMARFDLRESLHEQVEGSVGKGAECLLGGTVPDGKGAFYPPTILTGVKPGMPAYEEELFGPVASVIRVQSEQEALEVANDTSYGLGAAIFSEDSEKAERLASEQLEAGCCFVNDFVKSDPRLPFGGIKESGYGRELSRYGIREFVNIKTVYVK